MLYRYLIAYLFTSFFLSDLESQSLSKPEILNKVFAIEDNSSISDKQKLKDFYVLEKAASRSLKDKDSVYAWILLKIGKYEYIVNHDYDSTIKFTKAALQVNNASNTGSSIYLNINAFFNLGSAFETLLSYPQALKNYDSSINLASKFIDTNTFALDARTAKANIYFSSGDYQKAVEESIKGAHLAEIENNTSAKTNFLNMQAQALFFQNNIEASLPIAYAALNASKKINDAFELATAYKTLALIYNNKKVFDSAKYYYNEAINYRLKTTSYSNIGADYNEFGNFYNGLSDYKNAAKCYERFLYYAGKITDPVDRSVKLSFAYLNYGESHFKQNKLTEAGNLYLKAMNTLKFNVSGILQNPPINKISVFGNRAELIITLMKNKTELLLEEYHRNNNTAYLKACIQTALVTDSVITQIRHEHISEQSKIYWRDKTNQFYAIAIEACYLDKNPSLAFYFFEKSRAVLLGDKLNELNATAYLPEAETKREESYQFKIVELEQKLAALDEKDKEFQNVQLQLLNAKDNFEHYIKSLEQKYPLYYQYKYADEVPKLETLQTFLSKSKQCFVHYFFSDSVLYALAIKADNVNFLRIPAAKNIKKQIATFSELCADKNRLNSNYNHFINLSNSLFASIFQPLNLPHGRIIICTDNSLIPFEALCSDNNGKSFLINNYSFDYVYSAGLLMQQFKNSAAKGSFIGFAPVSFSNDLHVPALQYADAAMQECAGFYKNVLLFTYKNATRNNFFTNASNYSIINIFSHASADTSSNEPVLLMWDSVIHLSELQLLNNPATQLVLLSACETNVGKNATGEGVYSLARGFAAAGIPAIAATLWKADEQSIYKISKKFNQYLSEGMNKDEALQKAKLYFIKNSGKEKLLPYYWANMVLIGNTDAVNVDAANHNYIWWIAVAGIAVAFLLFYIRKRFPQKKG
ncbi:MAG: CHAT domain-containing protein [Parafilimonas sp.]